MTPSARLLARIRSLGLPVEVPPDAVIRRTYVGYWQRRGGAWSWTVWPLPGSAGIGSQRPVGELVRADRLVALRDHCGDWHIDALEPGGRPSRVLHDGVRAEPPRLDNQR